MKKDKNSNNTQNIFSDKSAELENEKAVKDDVNDNDVKKTAKEKSKEKKLKRKNKEKPAKDKTLDKNQSRKKLNKSGGCFGCFGGIIATILCVLCLVVFAGGFVLDRFLVVNYNMSLGECLTLLNSVWTVDESKVVTEGEVKEQDREVFYSELADSLFIKDDMISELVDTALDEYVIPLVSDAISGKEQGAQTTPAFYNSNQGSQFDWETFLKDLLDRGVVDKDKINAYFENELPAVEKYDDYFVLKIQGKGLVSTVDYVINKVLSANPETEGLVNTFGLKQLKFIADEQSGGQIKKINIVLNVRLQKAVIGLLESPLFDKLVDDPSIVSNKGLIRTFLGVLPNQILLSLDLNIAESVTVDFRINNLSQKQVDKWLEFIKKVTGNDLKKTINDAVNSAYNNARDALLKYVDINDIIQNGSLDLDLFEILSVVLNEQMGLEGEKALNKIEASTTVSNVLYANMDVNGNGIENVVEEVAPSYVSENWKQDAQTAFLDWLKNNIAFKGDTFDDFVKKFKSETGKLILPSNFTFVLDFLDANYIRESMAFLKQGLKFDDRFLAYLFEDYKQEVFATAGYPELASSLSLKYVSITKEEQQGVEHNYLSLGLSANTKDLCKALGYEDFDFISSFVGTEMFICVTADVTLDKTVERTDTKLMINGLSQTQTSDILTTVKKLTGYDILNDLVDKNLDAFVDQFVDMTAGKYNLGFEIKTNDDGTTTGMIVLPSVADILQQVLISVGNSAIDVDKVIETAEVLLQSNPSDANYCNKIEQTSQILTGQNDTYATYDDVIDVALAKYFIQQDTVDIQEVFSTIIKAINGEKDALDKLLGTDTQDGIIKINREYFASNSTLDSTCPILDGHSIAYLINEVKDSLCDLFDEDVSEILGKIDVKDINISDGYLYLTVASTPSKILSLEQTSMLDEKIKTFIYSIFGGQDEFLTITAKINVGSNAEKIGFVVQSMTEEQMQSVYDLLKAFGITMFDFADENNQLVKIANQIAEYINKYATIDNNTAKLPSIFSIIAQYVDFNGTKLTTDDAFLLTHSLATYKNATADAPSADYETALNTQIATYYAIENGYDTIKSMLNGSTFSIDSLSFNASKIRDGNRDYVKSFIYDEKYLSTFINAIGLIEQGGFTLNKIEVVAKDEIRVNLIVELSSVINVDLGLIKDILPQNLSITIPIKFNSSAQDGWEIVGLSQQSEVVEILSSIGMDVTTIINDQRDNFIETTQESLAKHGLSFDVDETNETRGLLLPSICKLYSNEKQDVSEQDAVYLFDNLVCYEAKEHSIFTDEYTKQNAEDEFMAIMSKYYRIKSTYSGDAKYVDKDGNERVVSLTDIPVTYQILLASFGFYIDDYEGYLIETEDLMDIDDLSILLDENVKKDLSTDVLIKNEIITLWMQSVGSANGFELEKIKVVDNNVISLTGFINMSDHLSDSVCATAKSLMCEKLNVTMQINLASNSLMDYYIEDLKGDVDNSFEEITDESHTKTKKLIEIIKCLDPSIDVSDDTFADIASTISERINGILQVIKGTNPITKESQTAKAVNFGGAMPENVTDFGVTKGFLLPNGLSYAYANCEEFRTAFDTYYQQSQN